MVTETLMVLTVWLYVGLFCIALNPLLVLFRRDYTHYAECFM